MKTNSLLINKTSYRYRYRYAVFGNMCCCCGRQTSLPSVTWINQTNTRENVNNKYPFCRTCSIIAYAKNLVLNFNPETYKSIIQHERIVRKLPIARSHILPDLLEKFPTETKVAEVLLG